MIEMVVVIAVLAIITAFAIPSFQNLQKDSAISAATIDLVADLKQMRSEAVTRKTTLTFTPAAAGNWAAGWTVADSGGTQFIVRKRDAGKVTAVMSPNTVTSISINRDGTVQGWVAMSLKICDDRSNETGRQLSISRIGQITNTKVACGA